MLVSVAIALSGFAVARSLFNEARSGVPARLLEQYPTIHRLAFNKYYIDEFYQATAIRGSVALSRLSGWFDQHVIDGLVNLVGHATRMFSWLNGLHDTYVIDGAVNGVASVCGRLGQAFRRLQTGQLQTYLYGLLGGGLLIVLARFFIK
jgi:NADH-quinone oxidoreductase subunit L